MLRASDADRERTANRVRHASSEGRLLPGELEQRLEAALSARTYGELDQLVSDLPDDNTRNRWPLVDRVSLRRAIALGAALLVALALTAAALRLGFGRSSAAAANQTPTPGMTQGQGSR
jgi:DUF1707 SHOCT-like domain